MNSIQVKCFLNLAQTGSYADTEEQLFLSQHSVRKYIADLEEEMSMKLFVRRNKSLSLTPDGEVMFRFFSLARNNYHSVLSQARKLDGHSIPVPVAILEGLETTDGIMDRLFQTDIPGISGFNISYKSLAGILNSLSSGEVALAVMLDFPALKDTIQKKGLCMRLLKKDSLCLYFSSSRFAARNELPSKEDFQHDTFFLLPNVSRTMKETPEELAFLGSIYYQDNLLGFETRFRTLDSMSSIIMHVASGDGVTIALSQSRIRHEPHITSIPLEQEVNIMLVWRRKNKSPLLMELMDCFPAIPHSRN